MEIKIAPSILASDFSRLGETVQALERCGADLIHFDVMDGNFVPPITLGAQAVAAIRPHTRLPLDCHLMVTRPLGRVAEFAQAGADLVTVHAEAVDDVAAAIASIHACGVKAGLVIRPETPVEAVFPVCETADLILVMGVVPGWGGQKLIPATFARLEAIRNRCLLIGRPALDLEIDGGVTEENAGALVRAGANVLVAGSAVFRSSDMAATIRRLRG